ncbi:MAG: SMP-30/gluconolactonase/LRE family protein [Phycisphaerae bacterium]|nr:SMP-30/gluconolactonase/LRE family protein [Phycisphaerae bacterium]
MKNFTSIALLLLCTLTAGCQNNHRAALNHEIQMHGLLAEGATVQELASDFNFTEGPAADTQGNVYFTDIPNNRIHKFSIDNKLSLFKDDTGGANGLYFDKNGNLLACAGGAGKLVRFDLHTKMTETLADKFNNKSFNSPNDLWPDHKGGIYFTDPRYGRDRNLPQDGEHVYYLPPDGKNIIRVVNDMVRPNGLIGTPDGNILYITDNGAGKTWKYHINSDGSLTDKTLFAEVGSDGMTIDILGNVYLTTNSIEVYQPSGQKLTNIPIPQRPTNVTFGGKNNDTLFITARKSLYAIKLRVTGAE